MIHYSTEIFFHTCIHGDVVIKTKKKEDWGRVSSTLSSWEVTNVALIDCLMSAYIDVGMSEVMDLGFVCKVCTWYVHVVHMVCTWCAHGVYMVCTWCAHGVYMVCTWCAHGVHMLTNLSCILGIQSSQ